MDKYVCIKPITMGDGQKFKLGDVWNRPGLPEDGKGNSLVNLSSKQIRRGKTAAFELVTVPDPEEAPEE